MLVKLSTIQDIQGKFKVLCRWGKKKNSISSGNQVAPDDVALLRLAQSLVYTALNVRPIPIPPQGSVHTGTALLSGWGLTQTGGSLPNNLQVANKPIVPAAGESLEILDLMFLILNSRM